MSRTPDTPVNDDPPPSEPRSTIETPPLGLPKEPDGAQPRYTNAALLTVLGLWLMGVGGGFAPWVWREAVALQLTAPGLAEFVKFLPEVRTGQLHPQRLYFLTPLFVAMLLLPLLTANRQLHLPNWLRWGVRLTVIPLALAALSPVWTPTILLAPEFRLQTSLTCLSLALVGLAPLLRHIPLMLLQAALLLGGGLSLFAAGWQFSLVHAPLEAVYHQPIAWGNGWWLTLAGWLISLLASLFVRPLSGWRS